MMSVLKSYPSPWKGNVLLACRKCQKKLKGNEEFRALAKLKKTVKRRNKETSGSKFTVIDVPCMDLCPKNGVVVCDSRHPRELHILRASQDLERLPGSAAGVIVTS